MNALISACEPHLIAENIDLIQKFGDAFTTKNVMRRTGLALPAVFCLALCLASCGSEEGAGDGSALTGDDAGATMSGTSANPEGSGPLTPGPGGPDALDDDDAPGVDDDDASGVGGESQGPTGVGGGDVGLGNGGNDSGGASSGGASGAVGANGGGGNLGGASGESGSGGAAGGLNSGGTGGLESLPCTRNADCNNGLACDGTERCEEGFCVAGTPMLCDDGVDCTLDVCDATTDGCDYIPQNSRCTDGVFCNGVEICDPTDGCEAGTPPDCTDTIDCTEDSCDEDNDRCSFVPDDSICDDSLYCNGGEVCDVGAGCGPGSAPDCNDMLGCTADSCDEDADACVNTPDDLFCSNGVYCDGLEVCTPGVGCEPGVAVECSGDGIACTADVCNEAAQGCVSNEDSAACPVGQFCVSDVGCQIGQACADDTECDDLDACNGVESCVAPDPGDPGTKFCHPGTPVTCNDGLSCTEDACEPSDGSCVFTPQHGRCADTNLCNGSEVCDLTLGCIAGAPLDCDDGVDCTDDSSCLPASGCLNRPIDDLCQDTSACNGHETCDATLGCMPGTPLSCPSDGIACTVDTCDDDFGGCRNIPDDTVCNSGGTCTAGALLATCDVTLGCGNHCQVATCQGKVYQCGNCKDDDGDCKADDRDSDCFGACDNNESGWKGEIPGQDPKPCNKMDCYFDQDNGSGNDDCFWNHKCDALTQSCTYDNGASIPGTSQSCSEAAAAQSATCNSFCGPLAPNGCDCFGCCEVFKDGASYTVYIGTEDAGGNGSCNLAVADQPDKCHSCTQVPGCYNACDTCELCLGKDTLPPECGGVQSCGESQPCGLPGQSSCPAGEFCLTGCCTGF